MKISKLQEPLYPIRKERDSQSKLNQLNKFITNSISPLININNEMEDIENYVQENINIEVFYDNIT